MPRDSIGARVRERKASVSLANRWRCNILEHLSGALLSRNVFWCLGFELLYHMEFLKEMLSLPLFPFSSPAFPSSLPLTIHHTEALYHIDDHTWQIFREYLEWGEWIIAPTWKTWSFEITWKCFYILTILSKDPCVCIYIYFFFPVYIYFW